MYVVFARQGFGVCHRVGEFDRYQDAVDMCPVDGLIEHIDGGVHKTVHDTRVVPQQKPLNGFKRYIVRLWKAILGR